MNKTLYFEKAFAEIQKQNPVFSMYKLIDRNFIKNELSSAKQYLLDFHKTQEKFVYIYNFLQGLSPVPKISPHSEDQGVDRIAKIIETHFADFVRYCNQLNSSGKKVGFDLTASAYNTENLFEVAECWRCFYRETNPHDEIQMELEMMSQTLERFGFVGVYSNSGGYSVMWMSTTQDVFNNFYSYDHNRYHSTPIKLTKQMVFVKTFELGKKYEAQDQLIKKG